jgi:hypothetical protein
VRYAYEIKCSTPLVLRDFARHSFGYTNVRPPHPLFYEDNEYTRLGVLSSEPRERKLEEIQRATEQSVALIISISQAPPRRSESSSAPPQPDQPVEEEEVSPITYVGHVEQLDAIFFLKRPIKWKRVA